MTYAQKKIFAKFSDRQSEYMSLAKAAIIEYAFKFGMQITIETLTKTNQIFTMGAGSFTCTLSILFAHQFAFKCANSHFLCANFLFNNEK